MHCNHNSTPKTGDRTLIQVTFPVVIGGIRGERLWARKMGKDTAKLENIPFCTTRLTYGDLVRFDSNRVITEIIEHVGRNRILVYDYPRNEPPDYLGSRYIQVEKHLEKYGILKEDEHKGILSISVPNEIDEQTLEAAVDEFAGVLMYHDDEPPPTAATGRCECCKRWLCNATAADDRADAPMVCNGWHCKIYEANKPQGKNCEGNMKKINQKRNTIRKERAPSKERDTAPVGKEPKKIKSKSKPNKAA